MLTLYTHQATQRERHSVYPEPSTGPGEAVGALQLFPLIPINCFYYYNRATMSCTISAVDLSVLCRGAITSAELSAFECSIGIILPNPIEFLLTHLFIRERHESSWASHRSHAPWSLDSSSGLEFHDSEVIVLVTIFILRNYNRWTNYEFVLISQS